MPILTDGLVGYYTNQFNINVRLRAVSSHFDALGEIPISPPPHHPTPTPKQDNYTVKSDKLT